MPVPPTVRVLIADASATARRELARALLDHGLHVLTAESAEAALALARSDRLDVALVGPLPPLSSGLSLLSTLASLPSPPELLALVDEDSVSQPSDAYEVITRGNYLPRRVVASVERAHERRTLRAAVQQNTHTPDPPLVGHHRLLRRTLQHARAAARAASPVHIEGEEGTGKELLARTLHGWSARSALPFVGLAGSALSTDAFRSATSPLLTPAHEGTLYVHEIDQISPSAQADLEQLLLAGLPFRLITASTRSLYRATQAGTFRADLFVRLTVIYLPLPPLRQRRDDIPLLVHELLRRVAHRNGYDAKRISTEGMRLLRGQDWPGNIRQLESVLERATLLSSSNTLFPGDLSTELPIHSVDSPSEAVMTNKHDFTGLSLPTGWDELPYADAKERALDSFHAAYLGALLRRTGGNISEAARRAGLDRSNFRRVLKRYGNPLAPNPGAAAAMSEPTDAPPAGPTGTPGDKQG